MIKYYLLKYFEEKIFHVSQLINNWGGFFWFRPPIGPQIGPHGGRTAPRIGPPGYDGMCLRDTIPERRASGTVTNRMAYLENIYKNNLSRIVMTGADFASRVGPRIGPCSKWSRHHGFTEDFNCEEICQVHQNSQKSKLRVRNWKLVYITTIAIQKTYHRSLSVFFIISWYFFENPFEVQFNWKPCVDVCCGFLCYRYLEFEQ